MRGFIPMAIVVSLFWPSNAETSDLAKGRPGALPGVWLWTLPDSPNGLRPIQSWHATGSTPSGSIFVGGMDHKTNSALYELDAGTGLLRFLGDARSASEAAKNWLPNETVQKFHTRPLWHDGKIYVATMNRSTLDDGYLAERGFHWYSFDPDTSRFEDLSASEPGGTAVPHGNVVTLASDPARNVIYAAGVPTGEIFEYDVARRRTTPLGRPPQYNTHFVYSGRVMWVSRGRLYFSAGNGQDPTAYSHMYYYEPGKGFGERKDWPLRDSKALEVGQCQPDLSICYFSDDKGHVYKFDEERDSWSYLGQIDFDRSKFLWLFQLSPDFTKVYVSTSGGTTSMLEFDLRNAKTKYLCSMGELDPILQKLNIHTGYDAWDLQGRFYFSSFSLSSNQNVVLVRVDPAALSECQSAAK